MKTANEADIHRQSLRRAEQSVSRVDGVLVRLWRELLAALMTGDSPAAMQATAQRSLADIAATLEKELSTTARATSEAAAAYMVRRIPRRAWMKYFQRLRDGETVEHTQPVTEMMKRDFDPDQPWSFARRFLSRSLDYVNELDKLVGSDEMDDGEFTALVKSIVFPPPTKKEAAAILNDASLYPDRVPWKRRLAGEGFSFKKIVGTVTTGIGQGKSPKDIAKDLRPLVDDVRYRATRIARTETLRVAQTMQRRSEEAVDDLIVGREMVAVLDDRTRPHHRERDGQRYMKDGHQKAGDEAWDDAPSLPDEPNCRCRYKTLVAGLDDI